MHTYFILYSSTHSFIHPSIPHPSNPSMHTYFILHSSTHSFIHPSIHPSIHLIHTCIHPLFSTHPPIHSSTHLSTHPSIHPSIHLSIFPFFHPSMFPITNYPFIHKHITELSVLCQYEIHPHQ